MSGLHKDERLAHILELFNKRGHSNYGGEEVTQLEHALQAAMFADRAGADEKLVAAALLHDIGHLLHDLDEDAPDHGIDDVHEERAADWLEQHFPPEVVEPVRLHVTAKRYLCVIEPKYLQQLSEPSLQSLKLQGGPMSAREVVAFEANPYFTAAVKLRRWDEAAKIVDLKTPDIEYYAPILDRVLLPR